MVRVELSEDEAVLVREVLEAKAQSLLVEIRHTAHREFRQLLKARSAELDRIIQKIAPVAERA